MPGEAREADDLTGFLPDVAAAIAQARAALEAGRKCCDKCHESVSAAIRPYLAAAEVPHAG